MAKIPEIGFVVDENSDRETAIKVMKDLRRMVRYGKMAERALLEVKRTGFCTSLTPVAPLPQLDHYGGYSVQGNNQTKRKTEVRFVRLHKRLGISREDLGPMDKLHIEMGKIKETKYAGNPTKEIPLLICGPLAQQTVTGEAQYEIVDDKRECGTIRINKNHLSWLSPAAYGSGDAHRVYKEMKYSGAKESMTAFAKGVSGILVVKASNDMLAAAKTLDLQNNAWQWFLEDGHAERMFRDIHELTRVIEVMDS